MPKLKKIFSFSGKGNIWRLIIDDRDNLVIETRDTETKQVYFDYIDIESGKSILKNFRMPEKFWIGIEKVYNGIIYFHKFAKPDMPGHRGIIAYSIEENKILWEKEELIFSFLHDEKIYCFTRGFEKNKNYTLDLLTGEITSEIPDEMEFKNIRERAHNDEDYSEYKFPERYFPMQQIQGDFGVILEKLSSENQVEGLIEFAVADELLFYNFHTKNSDGTYNNYFRVNDTVSGKILLDETINKRTQSLIPDCFFLKGDKLFLLKETKKVLVYKLIK